MVKLRATPAELADWQQAASSAGVSLSRWLRAAADTAAFEREGTFTRADKYNPNPSWEA